MRYVSIAVSLVAAVSLTGCVTTIWPKHTTVLEKSGQIDYFGTLPGAIKEARELQREYIDNLDDEALARALLALTSVPLAGAGIFLGLTSDGRATKDFLTGSAIGLTSAFSLASLFDNPIKRKAYVYAVQAINCAIEKAEVLLVQTSTHSIFNRNLNGDAQSAPANISYSQLLSRVDLNLKVMREGLASLSQAEKSQQPAAGLAAWVSIAEGYVTQAEELKLKAVALERAWTSVGERLRGELNGIAARVYVEAAKGDFTIDSVRKIVMGIGPMSETMRTTLAPPPPPAVNPKAVENLDAKAQSVGKSVTQNTFLRDLGYLAARTQALADQVNAVAAAQARSGSSMDCQVDGIAIIPIAAKPASQRIMASELAAKDREIKVTLSGGKPPYFGQLNGLTPAEGGIELAPVTFTNAVVKVLKGTSGGTYEVDFSDAAGNSLAFPIQIVAETSTQQQGQQGGKEPKKDQADSISGLAKFALGAEEAKTLREGFANYSNPVAELDKSLDLTDPKVPAVFRVLRGYVEELQALAGIEGDDEPYWNDGLIGTETTKALNLNPDTNGDRRKAITKELVEGLLAGVGTPTSPEKKTALETALESGGDAAKLALVDRGVSMEDAAKFDLKNFQEKVLKVTGSGKVDQATRDAVNALRKDQKIKLPQTGIISGLFLRMLKKIGKI
tara:strand:+ start:416 stop:2437 length:2022 start_codon:yes stop_codon:yes gene_type:complete